MYLHFEDWSGSMWLGELDKDELPHSGKIIKVMASDLDPSKELEKPTLTVVASDGAPFTAEETYVYPDRETYGGSGLEETLGDFNLNPRANRAVRALFRFANQHGFCQAAMTATTEKGWLIDHPFGDIDGIEAAQRQPGRETGIHLDIFFPNSVSIIRNIVDIDDPQTTLTMREGLQWRRQQLNTDMPRKT
jgi:hypothetical protein